VVPASGRGRLGHTFTALRFPDFRIYLAGQSVVCVGVWMQGIALDWLVLELTDSPVALGLTLAVQFLPVLLLGMVGGIVSDRYPRRAVLIGTQTTYLVLNATMASLVIPGNVRVHHAYVFAFAVGVVLVLDSPARQVFTGELVPAGYLPAAIALNSVVFHASRLLGPAAAAVLISTTGTGWVFAVNAASHLLSVLALASIRPRTSVAGPVPPTGPGGSRTVLRHLAAEPRVAWTIVLVAVVGTFGLKFPIVLTAMADSIPGGGAPLYGLFNIALAAGSVAGAILGGRCAPTRLRTVVIVAAAFGATQIVTAVVPGLVAFLVALVVLGAVNLAFQIMANSFVQTWTAPHMRGRVMSLYLIALIGGAPVGGPVIGQVCAMFGPRVGMFVCGAIPLVAALLVAWRCERRGDFRREPFSGRVVSDERLRRNN
jgi:MFS family permease